MSTPAIKFAKKMKKIEQKEKGGGMLDRKLKQKVLKRDKFRCLLCGTKKHLTVDHILPKTLGGKDHLNNLQILCEYHNRAKGCWNVKDYRGNKGLKAQNPYTGSYLMMKKNFLT